MPTNLIRVCITVFIINVLCVATVAQNPVTSDVKFEVLSVVQLSDKEAADRSPDFVGPNVAVRLRLSTAEHGVSFYGWPNGAVPSGYKIEFDGSKKVWLFGEGGTTKRPTSPGIDAVLFGSKGAWINLPSHSAIEWEELDSSVFAGKKHAYTAFVRGRAGDETEIFSSQFTVPLKTSSSVPSAVIYGAGHAGPQSSGFKFLTSSPAKNVTPNPGLITSARDTTPAASDGLLRRIGPPKQQQSPMQILSIRRR
jgi:hypothetical protein